MSVCGALLSCGLLTSAQQEPANTSLSTPISNTMANKSEDEAAIQTIVKGMESGWNNKDSAEFTKNFAADAHFADVKGDLVKGRSTAEEVLRKPFQTVYKDMIMDLNVQQIKFLRPDVAIVDIILTSHARQDPTATSTAHLLLVVDKNNGKWEVATMSRQVTQLWVEFERKQREAKQLQESTNKTPGKP